MAGSEGMGQQWAANTSGILGLGWASDGGCCRKTAMSNPGLGWRAFGEGDKAGLSRGSAEKAELCLGVV